MGAWRGPLRAPILAAILLGAASACSVGTAAKEPAPAASNAAPIVAARVLERYPHDPQAFTQGLLVRDGRLYESTGQIGRSWIREVELATGKVVRQVSIPPGQFGEGLADWGDELISITWQSGVAHRWRLKDFKRLGDFSYAGEGWGLARGPNELAFSDGTQVVRFLDPKTFKELRQVTVTLDGQPLALLNELEWVDGELLANIWLNPHIARIDPATGRVKGLIDLGDVVRTTPVRGDQSVLNGIAWDRQTRRLYVTGKNWPYLYRIAWPAG